MEEREQILGGSYQSATLPPSLHFHLPFISLALPLRTLTHCLCFRKLCVQSVDHLGEFLTFSYPGATYLPLLSVTVFPVSMSFFLT